LKCKANEILRVLQVLFIGLPQRLGENGVFYRREIAVFFENCGLNTYKDVFKEKLLGIPGGNFGSFRRLVVLLQEKSIRRGYPKDQPCCHHLYGEP
jgi:hypothetical protein